MALEAALEAIPFTSTLYYSTGFHNATHSNIVHGKQDKIPVWNIYWSDYVAFQEPPDRKPNAHSKKTT